MPKWPTFDLTVYEYVPPSRRPKAGTEEEIHNLNGVLVRLVDGMYWQVVTNRGLWESRSLQRAFRRARVATPKYHKHVGELFAYRGWGLAGDILTPVTRLDDWETWAGPVARAEITCEHDGLYAVKINKHYISQVMDYNPAVHGFVELSGRVDEHERGYRSTVQTVRLLRVVPPVGDVIIKAFEDRYQCQVLRDSR